MVQVSYPGVYIKEVPSGSRTITGVSTSITAFVGATKRGPVGEPVAVLSYSDYVRNFSDDTQVSEMTDQVRQFFLNGGQQAYILRVASGAETASALLPTYLELSARGVGDDGNNLRAVVDYATAEPESTFNLTIYREAVGPTGLGEVVEQEQFKSLSMNPSSVRFASDVINRDSQLCKAKFTATDAQVTAALLAGVSIGGRLLKGVDYGTAATSLIAATKTITSATWKFRIIVGPVSKVVSVTATAFASETALTDAINGDATSHTVTAKFANTAGTSARCTVTFKADSASDDVRIEPVGDVSSDIAALLGWGTAQGGLEFGAHRALRPRPNGLVSPLEPSAATLLALATTITPSPTPPPPTDGSTPPDDTNETVLAGPESTLTLSLQPPKTWGTTLSQAVASDDAPSLLSNLAAYFERAASAFNSALSNTSWSAQVQGLRLSFVPTYGTATAGAGQSFTDGPTWLVGATGLFASTVVSTARGVRFVMDATKIKAPEVEDYAKAFDTLESKVDLFNILVLPRTFTTGDDKRANIWANASAFCQRNRAFLIIDATNDVVTIDSALQSVKENRLGIVKDHSAMYWPRVAIKPDSSRRYVDPAGTIAGIMARTDGSRGVWKAPAGTEADLRGVFGVETPMSDRENGRLNPEALNCIRAFTSGIISWGARTMDGFDNSGNDDYKYVPVRRFALFLEESLYRGLQWAVFEPNDQRLWSQIRMTVSSFMNGLFRQGAFFGETSKEAYFVKVDAETTTPNDINLGICNVVVGFAPVKPAEFIVVTIKQKAGQVQV